MAASPNAFRKFGNECPGGTDENSPAFQRWDVCHTRTSPEGTAERWRDPVHVQPSLRDSNSPDVLPGVETPGYSRVVPPGQWFAIRPGNFRKAFRLAPNPASSGIVGRAQMGRGGITFAIDVDFIPGGVEELRARGGGVLHIAHADRGADGMAVGTGSGVADRSAVALD